MSTQSNHSKLQSLKYWIDYLKGKLSGKESHAFEKRLLHDDFEAEAYEGLSAYKPEEVEADLEKLSSRIDAKTNTSSGSFAIYWRAAAILILLTSITFTIFKLGFDNISNEEQVSEKEETIKNKPPVKSAAEPLKQDSSLDKSESAIAMNYTNEESKTGSANDAKAKNPSVAEEAKPLPRTLSETNTDSETDAGSGRVNGITSVEPVSPSEGDVKEKELVGTPDPYKLDNTGVGELPSSDEVTKRSRFQEGIDSKIKVKPELEDQDYTKSRKLYQANEKVSSRAESVPQSAQAEAATSEPVAISKAQPIGGFDKFYKFIEDNIDASLKKKDKNRIVKLRLHINKDGDLSDVEVIESPGNKYEKDAIKVVKQWSGWNPAIVNGELVESRIEVEVRY